MVEASHCLCHLRSLHASSVGTSLKWTVFKLVRMISGITHRMSVVWNLLSSSHGTGSCPDMVPVDLLDVLRGCSLVPQSCSWQA
jgi:hypothetical protein